MLTTAQFLTAFDTIDAVAAGLHAEDLDALVAHEGMEHADGVGAAADARHDAVGQPPHLREHLRARLVADDALGAHRIVEHDHDRRRGMTALRAAHDQAGAGEHQQRNREAAQCEQQPLPHADVAGVVLLGALQVAQSRKDDLASPVSVQQVQRERYGENRPGEQKEGRQNAHQPRCPRLRK